MGTIYFRNTTQAIPGVTAPVAARSGLGGGEFALSATSGTGTIGPVEVPNGTSPTYGLDCAWGYQPGVQSAASYAYSFALNVTSGSTDITGRMYVSRRNSAGTVQGSRVLMSNTGTLDARRVFTVTTDLGAFASDDWLVFELETHSSKAHGGNASYTLTASSSLGQVLVPWTPAVAEIDCVAYRFRNGDTVTLNAGTDWAAAQNTVAEIEPDRVFRLRFEFQARNGETRLEASSLEYRYDLTGGTSYTSWATVPNNSTYADAGSANGQKRVQAVPSAQYTDGAGTTNLLTAGTGTFATGYGRHISSVAPVTLSANGHTEHEFCLLIRKLSQDGHVPDGARFQFRLTGVTDTTPTIVGAEMTVKNRPGHIGGAGVETPHRNLIQETGSGAGTKPLYHIVEYTDMTSGTFRNEGVMMKSTDDGVSWNPTVAQGQFDWEASDMVYEESTDTIHVLLQGPNANSDVLYRKYYTSAHATLADSWDAGGWQTVHTATNGDMQMANLHLVASSRKIAFYGERNGTDKAGQLRIQSSGGTWSSASYIETPASGNDAHPPMSVYDSAADVVHAFWTWHDNVGGTSGELHHCAIQVTGDSTYSQSPIHTARTGIDGNYAEYRAAVCPPIIWDDSGTKKIAVLTCNRGDRTAGDLASGDLYFVWATIPGDPINGTYTWNTETINDNTTNRVVVNGIGSQSLGGGITQVGSDIHCVWAKYEAPPGADMDLLYDVRSGGSWGTNATESDGTYRTARMHLLTGNRLGIAWDGSRLGGTGLHGVYFKQLASSTEINPVPTAIAISGSTANITATAEVDPVSTAITVTGSTADVVPTTEVDPTPTAITVTGSTADITATANIDPVPTAITVTGSVADITTIITVNPVPTAITVTGSTADVVPTTEVDPVPTAVTVTGSTADVVPTTEVDPTPTAITVAGSTADITATANIDPVPTAITVTGSTADITATANIDPVPTAISVTGDVANVGTEAVIDPVPTTISVTGSTADVVPTTEVDPVPTAVTVAGSTADITATANIDPVPTAITVTGSVADITTAVTIDPVPTAITVTGSTADVVPTTEVDPVPTAISVTSSTADITATANIDPVPTAITVTGSTADISAGTVIDPVPTTISVTGSTADVVPTTEVDPVPTVISVTSSTADITATANIDPVPTTITVTGSVADITTAVTIDPVPTAISVTSSIADITATANVDPVPTAISVTSSTADITATADIDPVPTTISVTGDAADVTYIPVINPVSTTVTLSGDVVDIVPTTEVDPVPTTITLSTDTADLIPTTVVDPVSSTISVTGSIADVFDADNSLRLHEIPVTVSIRRTGATGQVSRVGTARSVGRVGAVSDVS